MKIKFKNLIIILIASLAFFEACTADFEEINTSPNSATVVPGTNVLGRALLSSSYALFSERLDVYYAGSYAGHTAAIGAGDYEYRVGINNNIWRGIFDSMAYAIETMQLGNEEDNSNLSAAALTLKAYMAHKATDMWGKIPYSEAFKLQEEVIYPKYDTEEEVYIQILNELKMAADMFNSSGEDLGAGDFLFNGDIEKWKKFCNSIRLRVAIRMSSADENAAKATIADVLNNPSKYPILSSNEDNAYFWWPGTPPDIEPWYARMGADDGNKTDQYRTNNTLISVLLSNNDPRLPIYADKNKYGQYKGYKFGPTQLSDTLNNGNNVSHIGDRFGNNPAGFSPFMNSAEVFFLKAEAYERNLISGGNAKEAYEMGITMSLHENGIDDEAISNYLKESEVAWNSGTSSNLEKIYLQKWISLFKQSVEAWAEERRTDVPLILDISRDYADSHNRPPLRMPYPDSEKSLNTSFPKDVVETDIFWGTQLWWDKRQNIN